MKYTYLVLVVALLGVAAADDLFGQTGTVGGNGGSSFDDGAHYVRGFQVRHGNWVTGLQFFYEDTTEPYHGGLSGGGVDVVSFADDEWITSADIDASNWINTITFHTTAGKTYGPYGTQATGSVKTIDVGEGNVVIGLFGASGDQIDRVGFHWVNLFFLENV